MKRIIIKANQYQFQKRKRKLKTLPTKGTQNEKGTGFWIAYMQRTNRFATRTAHY